MAFKYRKNLLGENGRMLRKYILDASTDFQVGDAVAAEASLLDDPESGEVGTATAGIRIVGIIEAIVQNTGVAPADNGCSGAFVDQFRTAANNETAAKVSALVDISPFSVYSGDLDNTIGTTTGTNRAFYFIDLGTAERNDLLGEASVLAPSTGGGQFVTHGRDPQDSNNILVSIRESFLHGDSGY